MKTIIQSIKTIVLAIIIAFGITYVFAAWTEPSCDPNVDPAACNTSAPLTVGTDTQAFEGSKTLEGTTPGDAVLFDIGLGANGVFQTYNDTYLAIDSGANVGIGTTNPQSALDVSGDIIVRDGGNLKSLGLTHTISTPQEICVDQTGIIVFCNPLTPPTVSISASPNPIPVGYSTILSWTSTNAVSCVASGAWSGGKSLSGSETVTPGSTSAYTLTCTNSIGSTSDSITVIVKQWEATTGQGTTDESCDEWLSRTSQEGILNSPPGSELISGTSSGVAENFCAYYGYTNPGIFECKNYGSTYSTQGADSNDPLYSPVAECQVGPSAFSYTRTRR